MNTNSFDLKELQDLAKDNPFYTFLAIVLITGISKGIADGFPKLGPYIENIGKYACDKALAYLPKPAAQAISADDNIIDANINC